MQAVVSKIWRPSLTASFVCAGLFSSWTQRSNCSGESTYTRRSIFACCVPQYCAHWPTYTPTLCGSIHIVLSRFGIKSVLPARRGTQKLWSVSADDRERYVGVGFAGSLIGTCSSFAVTTPSFGYRYSHQNWCPITVTSSALAGFGAACVLRITRVAERNSIT